MNASNGSVLKNTNSVETDKNAIQKTIHIIEYNYDIGSLDIMDQQPNSSDVLRESNK